MTAERSPIAPSQSALNSIQYAESLVTGRVQIAAGETGRVAAFIARQGVEELIDDYCRQLGAGCPKARTAAKLAIIRSLGDPDAARVLIYAWNYLSACCHQHSYELAPTIAEVRHQCESVIRVVG